MLRPVPEKTEITDIDLLISKTNLYSLVHYLVRHYSNITYRHSAYNSTIRIFVDRTILDIQFCVAFLPRKTLLLTKTWDPVSASFDGSVNAFIPDQRLDQFFTFWVFRLFLDKDRVDDSGSFALFQQMFHDSWKDHMNTETFRTWGAELFGEHFEQVKPLLSEFFSNGMSDKQGTLSHTFKQFVFDNHSTLSVKYRMDDIRFRIMRVLGLFTKNHPIEKLLERGT